jgi:hypothetical protein
MVVPIGSRLGATMTEWLAVTCNPHPASNPFSTLTALMPSASTA